MPATRAQIMRALDRLRAAQAAVSAMPDGPDRRAAQDRVDRANDRIRRAQARMSGGPRITDTHST